MHSLCKKLRKLLITLSFPQFPQGFPQVKKPQILRHFGLHNDFLQSLTFFDFFRKGQNHDDENLSLKKVLDNKITIPDLRLFTGAFLELSDRNDQHGDHDCEDQEVCGKVDP